MKIFCWFFLLTILACQDRKQTIEDSPNAVRDLLIDKLFWQKKTATQPPGRTTSVHRFTITNTSQRNAYQHIKIRFDYYDRNYHKIDSAIRIVEQTIGPRTAIKIDPLETKPTKEEITSSTATIVNASTD